MNNSKSKSLKSGASFLIFLAWLVYSTSYIGRVNYSANITQIIDFYGITKAEAGTVPTFMFFAYGIGQVLNGIMCKKYNIKWMIFISLFFSSIINLTIGVTNNFAIIKWLWMLNGILLSVLWPTLIRLMSENLPKKELGRSSVIIGTTVACGTIFIYALSSVYAIFDKFKLAFFTAAVMGILVSVFWILSYKKAVTSARKEMKEEKITEDSKKIETGNKNDSIKNKIYIAIGVLCFSAVGVNLIKDGLTTWVPSILKEVGKTTDSMSILLTLFLPLVSISGNNFALRVRKKVPNAITHTLITSIAMGIVVGIVMGGISIESVLIMLVGMIIVSFFASSLNSLITSIFPMFMRENINSGLWAGVLNGFCYVGSTISSYGLGVIADHFGWSAVFLCLLIACVLIIVVCLIGILIQRMQKSKQLG